MKFLRNLLWLSALLAILASCSASRLIKMAQRKDPSLFETRVDTVIVEAGNKAVSLDSVINSTEDEPLEFFVKTDIVGPDGTVRQDSARVEIRHIHHYNTEYLDSLIYLDRELTAEDSARIKTSLLDFTVDCPDCQETTKIITIKPTFWERVLYGLGTFIILILLMAAYNVFIKK